jgi:predicted permease
MTWHRRSALDRDRDEEFAAHLGEAIDYYKARGLSADEAARLARLRFGNPRAYREQLDELQRLPVLDVLARDVRYALRRIRQAPGFHAVIIVTLALAIGATSAVFSLADAILLRPLPLPDPDRLAVVGYQRVSASGAYTGPAVDGAMWAAVRHHARSVDAAVFIYGAPDVNFVANGTASIVRSQLVGEGYFRVLGIPPAIGREFTRAEAQPGGPAVAILSHDFWQRALQGRPDAMDQTIRLRGEPYTVVGVLPAEVPDFVDADVFTPLRAVGQGLNYRVVARLRADATRTQANAELAALGDEPFAMQRPNASVTRRLVLVDLQETLVAAAREPIVLLGWAVGAVLVIACVNIAVLLLARSATRAREIGTRMALGGSRMAVVRQLMVEAGLVAALGGAAGVFVAYAGLEGLKAIGGTTFSEWERVTLDARTVVVSFGLSVLTSLLFGLLPAWQTSRVDVQAAIAGSGSRSIAGGSRHLLRRGLVVAEVALSVVLLVGGGLLLRQLLFLQALDSGFSPANLYTTSVSLQDARYRDPAAIVRVFDASLERLDRTPGIEAAAVSQGVPYQRLLNMPFWFERQADDEPKIANIAYVTPGFFRTLGIDIVRGRGIADRDRSGTPAVVVVNEMFERMHLDGGSALGRRLRIGNSEGAGIEVVGVSRDVQQSAAGFLLTGMRRGPLLTSPTVYLPAAQGGDLLRAFAPVWTVRARSARDAAEAMSGAIAAADPLLPTGPVRSMAETASRVLAQPRLIAQLVGTLAAAALLLAAIGIYGLLAHVVSERTREFGIRLALGATTGGIVRAVALSGAALAGAGALLGIGLSFPASALIASFLPDLGTRDVPTYAGVSLTLVVIALVSSVLPALRAGRLEPVRVLREG